jgi:hypothetical protein
MDSDLVSSSGFQLAFDEGVLADLFDGANVSDGPLFGRIITPIGRFAPPVAVAPIANQDGVEGLFCRMAVDDCVVFANNTMVFEGFTERLGNALRSGKNHQAARVAVQTVDGDDRVTLAQSLQALLRIGPMGARIPSPLGPFTEGFLPVIAFAGISPAGISAAGIPPALGLKMMHQRIGDQFLERGLQLPSFSRKVTFLEVPDARDSSRFFDDYQEIIHMDDPNIGGFDRFWKGFVPKLDHVPSVHFSLQIHAQVPVHLNSAAPDRVANLTPTPFGQAFFQGAFEDGTVVGRLEMHQLKWGLFAFAHALLV